MSAYDKEWEIEQIELAIKYFEEKRNHNGVLTDNALSEMEKLTERLEALRAESGLSITKEDWQYLFWIGCYGQ